MRNDVPGGAEGLLVPPAGVAKAGGARARVLIEHYARKSARSSRFPCLWPIPPHRARPLPAPPALFLPSLSSARPGNPQAPLLARCHWHGCPIAGSPASGMTAIPPFEQARRAGCTRSSLKPTRWPAALGFALAMIAEQAGERASARDLVLWCLTKQRRAGMGTPLWARPHRLWPRPRAFSHRRGQDGRRRRLGSGRRAEEPGAGRSAWRRPRSRTPLAARRLSLAAQASRTPCLLLSGHRNAGLPGTAHPLAHRRAEEQCGAPFDAMAPGAPSWQLTLERCRGEAPGRSFIVEFSHELFRFHLSAASSDRAAEAGETASSDAPLEDDRPFALVGNEERGLVLTAVNAASASQGLFPGLGLADARAICPALLTLPASAEEGCRALARSRPLGVVPLQPDTECSTAMMGFGSTSPACPISSAASRRCLPTWQRRLARAGFTARLALAETLGGAHALARYARTSLDHRPARRDRGRARASSCRGLAARARDRDACLRRLGLKRIGQLYDLPRASLERRFHAKDTAEAVLFRLDQALGRREEPRVPLLPSPDFVARLPFPEPLITHEGVLAGLDHLASTLCAKLARAGRGCRRLALWVARADGSSTVIEAGLSAPSREPEHLLRLFEDKVEALDMGFGVDLMSLAALVTETLPPAQTSLTEANGKGRGRSPDRPPGQSLGRARRAPPLARAKPHPRIGARPEKRLSPALRFWPEPALAKPQRPPLLFTTA